MSSIIEIANATVFRGDTPVFDRLSLTLNAGENTAILGPNGAGKSTLLKLLSQDLYPVAADDTRVRILGRERWSIWDLRAHLGIVSNELQHDYRGSALGIDVVLSGLYASIGLWAHQDFSEADIARARRLLADLELTDLAERPFAAMSTGQQRRFLLGRALINEPDALVLDEPTSGLDLKACFHYLDIVRGLMKAGKTVILVTHHIHEIPPEITRVVLLKGGRVVADGAKTEILTGERLSALFEVPIRLVEADGFYEVLPGRA